MTGDKLNSKKYAIIHGHFYQPPRENPWLDIIEHQESAAPYSNWNECIYDQCYRPNAYSRLLDSKGRISGIHNNYQNISFNFGPTLYTWLEKYHPVTLKRIVAADQQSVEHFGGHGNAIAQVYNHIIMPLASKRDQLTQIRWAKYHFRKHFGRDPEGIWLGETAINMETALFLIEESIKFVILSPNQAEQFRHFDSDNWSHVADSGIDIRRPYRLFPKTQSGSALPGHLDVFFFDEGLSKEISFNDLLTNASLLGERIDSCYDVHSQNPQLVTIATDGETFGHHKPFGDMCLAYFFNYIAPQLGIEPVNFAYYLSVNPPEHEVCLKNSFGEGTAWSCAHGVGRWTRDCGCQTGGEPSWHQNWRKPLRDALNYVKSELDRDFEALLSEITSDPWKLRDDYIAVLGHESKTAKKRFLKEALGEEELEDRSLWQVIRVLEAQKYMLFSFTSCGWFFSDISGIETIQNLAYACRAIQLGITHERKEQVMEQFMAMLQGAPSNVKQLTGRAIFERHILPFYNHEQLLAFTVSVQQMLEMKKISTYNKSAYTFDVRSLRLLNVLKVNYVLTSVDLENSSSGEKSSWMVLISCCNDNDLKGWVLSSEKSALSEETFKPELWMAHEDAVSFTLHDTFFTCREELFDFFQQKMVTDTYERFEAWYSKNVNSMNYLSGLDISLPPYLAAPLGFVLQKRWNTLLGQLHSTSDEGAVFTELVEINSLIKKYAIEVDYNLCATTLQETIIKELISLSKSLTIRKCERLTCMMDIVDRFSIPVVKSKLEDLFSLHISGPISALYNSYVEQNDDQPKSNELLLSLLSFAGRMNFSTEGFRV